MLLACTFFQHCPFNIFSDIFDENLRYKAFVITVLKLYLCYPILLEFIFKSTLLKLFKNYLLEIVQFKSKLAPNIVIFECKSSMYSSTAPLLHHINIKIQ